MDGIGRERPFLFFFLRVVSWEQLENTIAEGFNSNGKVLFGFGVFLTCRATDATVVKWPQTAEVERPYASTNIKVYNTHVQNAAVSVDFIRFIHNSYTPQTLARTRGAYAFYCQQTENSPAAFRMANLHGNKKHKTVTFADRVTHIAVRIIVSISFASFPSYHPNTSVICTLALRARRQCRI